VTGRNVRDASSLFYRYHQVHCMPIRTTDGMRILRTVSIQCSIFIIQVAVPMHACVLLVFGNECRTVRPHACSCQLGCASMRLGWKRSRPGQQQLDRSAGEYYYYASCCWQDQDPSLRVHTKYFCNRVVVVSSIS
jgi:hypothetical protein